MKYRCLTYQEFDLLKDDFKDFLYSQKLNNYEWTILQDQYSNDAQNILERYSDLTFEKVLKEIKYLELRSSKELSVIKFDSNSYTTLGVKVPQSSLIDLTDLKSIESISMIDINGYRSFKKEDKYPNGREAMIFELIENGAYAVNSKSYDFLQLVRQSYQN